MCWLCEKYGNGGKWYLNPAHYARRLYKVRKAQETALGSDANPQEAGMGGGAINAIIQARLKGDREEEERVKNEALEKAYTHHFAQVVTLDESLEIMDIAYPIAKMTCGCRRCIFAMPDNENFTCIGIGPGMYKWERWPETYRGGVEFLSPEEAKDWVRLADRKGFVHTIDTFGTPYIGGLCQCEYPGCMAIRNRIDYDFKFLLKGEYVVRVDEERCTGCQKCVPRCHFRAINFNIIHNKSYIDMAQCFGCGLCATECPVNAIYLIDRNSLPALRENW
jgi:NAD-dependent dihydropyrimidine dehydrogenase PreA subunit